MSDIYNTSSMLLQYGLFPHKTKIGAHDLMQSSNQ